MKPLSALIPLLFIASLSFAETASNTSTTASSSSSVVADYHPSMGDLMTMAVQPRHIKLGLAGQNKNWSYAAYELSELRNAFNRVARTIPVYNSTDTAAIATAMTQEPLAAVERAIKAGDAKQFTSSYSSLTAACNACHQSQNKAMVVIKVPDASMFSDQDFRASKH